MAVLVTLGLEKFSLGLDVDKSRYFQDLDKGQYKPHYNYVRL